MWTVDPPLRAMRFVIEDVLEAPAAWAAMPAFADLDAATAAAVLEEAGRFTAGVLAPINGPGDLAGCTWEDGEVHTPPGFAAAYAAFVEGGWPALACATEDGGQGLPQLLNAALNEMLAAANHAWTMYPGLLHGAYDCLRTHGSEALKAAYLPRLVSGEWLPTMNLTEPQAGSDLALLRARAEPQPDGSVRLHGEKIFISGGEHDLTPNIVHLVLARLPDAPAGTRGLSLFLAPKVLPDGTRNAIRCHGLEKKMGIKGSATCAMGFEGATGWLIGQPHQGLAAMFVMMNAARLNVGLQGLGHLDAAAANARAYAAQRVQGRGRTLDAHPAVRHVLWRLRAQVDAGRVLAYACAMDLDEAHHHPDSARRREAEARAGLLTPVVKALLTHLGHHGADAALQVWGGYGYIHEYGIEQTVRDSRIAMVYEGTNEIQAIDLLCRKVLGDGGQGLARLMAAQAATLDALPASLADLAAPVRAAQADALAATQALLAAPADDPEAPLRVADDFLHGLGLTLLGGAWCRIAAAAARRPDDEWCREALHAARYGIEWLLPEAGMRWQRVRAGAAVPTLAPVTGTD